jgi:hypothetical protein
MSTRLVAVSLGLILVASALPAQAFSPTLFIATQEHASAAVLVRAQVIPGQPTRLNVLKTIFGPAPANEVVVEQATWLSGSKVFDQHEYVVLLDSGGLPYRGLLPDGSPSYFCGFINILEVKNDAVIDSQLYDVAYIKQPVPVPLAEVERALRGAHGASSGV